MPGVPADAKSCRMVKPHMVDTEVQTDATLNNTMMLGDGLGATTWLRQLFDMGALTTSEVKNVCLEYDSWLSKPTGGGMLLRSTSETVGQLYEAACTEEDEGECSTAIYCDDSGGCVERGLVWPINDRGSGGLGQTSPPTAAAKKAPEVPFNTPPSTPPRTRGRARSRDYGRHSTEKTAPKSSDVKRPFTEDDIGRCDMLGNDPSDMKECGSFSHSEEIDEVENWWRQSDCFQDTNDQQDHGLSRSGVGYLLGRIGGLRSCETGSPHEVLMDTLVTDCTDWCGATLLELLADIPGRSELENLLRRPLSKDGHADICQYFFKLEGGIKKLGTSHLCRAIPLLTPDCMVAFLLARLVEACQDVVTAA